MLPLKHIKHFSSTCTVLLLFLQLNSANGYHNNGDLAHNEIHISPFDGSNTYHNPWQDPWHEWEDFTAQYSKKEDMLNGYQHILTHLNDLGGELGEIDSPTHLIDTPDAHVNREKRRYNKSWFGKRISSREKAAPYISSSKKQVEGPDELSKLLHKLSNKRGFRWEKMGSPIIHKKWKPMISWKPRPINGNKRWLVARNKRVSPFGLSHSNNNVKVGTLGKFTTDMRKSLEQLYNNYITKRKNGPRRRSMTYTRATRYNHGRIRPHKLKKKKLLSPLRL